MLRNLYDTLRIKYAVWRHHRNRHQDHAYYVLTDAEQAAIDTLHGLNADTQARLRHAALLEAHDVSEELVQVICQIAADGRFTQESLNRIAEQGIAIDFGSTANEALRMAVNNAKNTLRTQRLQHAVKRLAFIAGPGFTTDHLIDEGIVQQGDL
jgi:hypothetical protein